MLHPSRLVIAGALLLCLVPAARAQAPLDPSGHWEGSIDVQGSELRFDVDLIRNSAGALEGTMSVPSQQMRGIRLLQVAVEGRTIRFHARRDQPFGGSVSPDGKSISGDYSIEGFSVPFGMTRTGDARVEPPLASRPITHALEGSWNATLQGNGMSMRLTLTMTNQPNGTAIGHVVNLDEGGLEIPVLITQDAARVTLQAGIAAGTFSGALDATGTELVGTWSEGAASVPLTFRRAGK